MIIRVTQKLADKLKVAPKACLPEEVNPLADWVAHLFTVQRVQYIIVTNSATLYSVVMHGRGISNEAVFYQRLQENISDFMTTEGFGDLFQLSIAPEAANIRLSKTGDRSVLGSINDHIRCAKVYLGEPVELSPFETSRRLNSAPMSMLRYARPVDAVRGVMRGMEIGAEYR